MSRFYSSGRRHSFGIRRSQSLDTGDKTLITGNTYPVKDQLSRMGGRWDAQQKGWWVPNAKAEEAQALVGDPAACGSNRREYRVTRRGGICEDAPCCGCCGPQGDGDYYGYSSYE